MQDIAVFCCHAPLSITAVCSNMFFLHGSSESKRLLFLCHCHILSISSLKFYHSFGIFTKCFSFYSSIIISKTLHHLHHHALSLYAALHIHTCIPHITAPQIYCISSRTNCRIDLHKGTSIATRVPRSQRPLLISYSKQQIMTQSYQVKNNTKREGDRVGSVI